MTITTTPLREAADRLIAAAATPQQCDPVRDILGDRDIASAYAVQRLLTEDSLTRGRQIVGHKIGLTSPAAQRQLGVGQPDSGVLFADMRVATGTTTERPLLQPKVEAEIAFLLADDLDGDLSESRIRAAAGVAVPAIEIVDSRVRDWSISIVDTIAETARQPYSCWGRKRWPLPTLISHRSRYGSPKTAHRYPPVGVRTAWAARSTRYGASPAPPRRTALRYAPDTSCFPVRWARWCQ